MSILLSVVVVVTLSLIQVSALFPSNFRSLRNTAPRCTSASKPCRIRAVMDDVNTINSHPCSCPESKPCSNDWQNDVQKIIVRELITDGNINMTLSMMFCDPFPPQRSCVAGDVALQLTGYSTLPTEVDVLRCTCTDGRPLVLDRRWTGLDHRLNHAYVCSNHKRRCNSNEICLVSDSTTHTDSYPCKCSNGMSCTYDNQEYRCKRRSSRLMRG